MTEQALRRRDPNRRRFCAALIFAAVAVFADPGSEGIHAVREGRTAVCLEPETSE